MSLENLLRSLTDSSHAIYGRIFPSSPRTDADRPSSRLVTTTLCSTPYFAGLCIGYEVNERRGGLLKLLRGRGHLVVLLSECRACVLFNGFIANSSVWSKATSGRLHAYPERLSCSSNCIADCLSPESDIDNTPRSAANSSSLRSRGSGSEFLHHAMPTPSLRNDDAWTRYIVRPTIVRDQPPASLWEKGRNSSFNWSESGGLCMGEIFRSPHAYLDCGRAR
jgi:hypothetical protein